MKILFTLLTALLFNGLVMAQDAKHYGEKINPEKALNMAQFAKRIAKVEEMPVKVSGEIEASCAVKGCWMTMRLPSGESMRVTFKDYDFFVPTEGLNGKTAIVQGMAKRSRTPVEDLRHYAKDGGATDEEIAKITEAKDELSFEAIGVLIYNE